MFGNCKGSQFLCSRIRCMKLLASNHMQQYAATQPPLLSESHLDKIQLQCMHSKQKATMVLKHKKRRQ